MGPKSKQGRHMLNMRMAHPARMRDRPARGSTFMRLNREAADKALCLSKNDIGNVSFLCRRDRWL
jgi:hypothetical protein